GRHGEAAALQASDEELIAWSLADLAEATGLRARPVDVHVQRWGGGLPQYALGHLDTVARVRAALPEGLVVAGAAYDGVGIPAVIGSAQRAVAELLTHLGDLARGLVGCGHTHADPAGRRGHSGGMSEPQPDTTQAGTPQPSAARINDP